MSVATQFCQRALDQWPGRIQTRQEARRSLCEIECGKEEVIEICAWLHRDADCGFAGLIVEELAADWELRYVFHASDAPGWVHVVLRGPLSEMVFPSISARVPAADWHEREAEDLFGLKFTGHPYLGDFILHNDAWQEALCPMRKRFDALKPVGHREPDPDWRPRRIVHAPGAFAMPIGPVFSGVTESAHFVLETVGEDVIRAFPRLFYNYRAVEKIAEQRSVDDVLLLAERFSATTAFAHALAFCQAAEQVAAIEVPGRGGALRVLLAELERVRHHAGAIQEICESTGLAVAASQAAILEEDLLRLSGAFCGHRYLFGVAAVGGLARDFFDGACKNCVGEAKAIGKRLDRLEEMLRASSSFLDRLEEVGSVANRDARSYSLVGPVARASGLARDLRKAQPYAGYGAFRFDVPRESEGDGYARLRVLFAEARQALRIMEQAAAEIPSGPVRASAARASSGAALGWVEAPRGATFHWLRIGESGVVERYRIVTPSFINWRGFHLAVENFAFQDFPIMLASFGLSATENDR